MSGFINFEEVSKTWFLNSIYIYIALFAQFGNHVLETTFKILLRDMIPAGHQNKASVLKNNFKHSKLITVQNLFRYHVPH